MKAIETIEKNVTQKKMPDFRVGDILKVHVRVKEGDKTRVQVFEGTCIRRRGAGAGRSFSVLKETHGNIVEKSFPLFSPSVEKITVSRKNPANRARLYHLRKK